jgi:putative aldouronate transport system substrate-binding protein
MGDGGLMGDGGQPPQSGRRAFLTTMGAAAAGMVLGACGKCTSVTRAKGSASSAAQTAAVLPAHHPLELLQPDIPGEGFTPAGFLSYPRQKFSRVVQGKPGRGGPPITTMTAAWGPAPLGLGNNAYLDAINAELGVTVRPSVQDGITYANKLSALLGARDVPDVLSVPTWEVDKIPRFSQAVKALFTDLTEYLQGEKVRDYPMLATLPTSAWQYCVWGGRLSAVPYPTEGVFPWAMFYRRDLTNELGIAPPSSIDELYQFGKKVTNPEKSVWAFGDTFEMVQMYFKCPGMQGGWRRTKSGGLEHKYELPEYREALKFTARLYAEGLVHPDLVASNGADADQLFKSGRVVMMRAGVGVWYAMQRDQQVITRDFDMQPLPLFAAGGGEPIAWGNAAPTFYTFVRKGLSKERTQEILRVLDWCGAPFGSAEYELNLYGEEGKHFTRAADNSPIATDLGRKELANQYRLIGGRVPVLIGSSEVPSYVKDALGYFQATAKYLEEDPFQGIKLEMPASASKVIIATEDKIKDVVRGRRPLSDLDGIVGEWRRSGGDEARAFLEKALADNGR